MLPAHNDSWFKKNDRPQNQNLSGTMGQHPWKYFLHNSMKVFRRFKKTVPGAEVEEEEKRAKFCESGHPAPAKTIAPMFI